MWNPGNVVMLATKEKATAPIFKRDAHLYIGYGEKLEYKNRDNSYQHLYITSYEEIKEGDWIRDSIGSIRQADSLDLKSNYPKIIATTDTLNTTGFKAIHSFVPPIPQSFIIYFIAEYNKGNVIDKVLVEYDEIVHDINVGDTKLSNQIFVENRIKLNADNTVNIKPIKDSWNREELIDRLDGFRYYLEERYGYSLGLLDEQDIKWIENNLK